MATIQGVYVALFGRPADPTGLAYFNGVTKNGADLSAIGNLAGQPEYTDRFAGQTNVQIVNSIYQSLFNRDADVAGLNFFVAGLNSGAFKINDIAIRILDGATGTDKTTVDLKVAAATAFTAALDTSAEIVGYNGAGAAAAGRAFISGVTTTAPTQAQIDAAVVTATNQPPTVGATFTLTAGNDFANNSTAFINNTIPSNFKFTQSNDGVEALNGTLAAADVLIDSNTADQDVLNIRNSGAAPVTGTITNIENINFIGQNAQVAAVDFTNVTGAKVVKASGTQAGALTINNAGASGVTTWDFSGVTTTGANGGVILNFGATTPTVALKVTGGAGNDTLRGGDAADTILGGAGVDTIVGGAGNDILNGGADGDTIDGGAGDNNIDGDAGDDTITAGNGNNTILTGAGTNGVTLGSGNNTVTGGAGNDTIVATSGNNIVALADGADSFTAGNGNNTVTKTGSGVGTINLGNGTNSVTTADGADSITVGTGANTIVSGAGVDTIVFAAANTGNSTLTAGGGADIVNLGAAGTGSVTINIGASDSAATLAGADRYTSFATAVDKFNFGLAAGDTTNYAEVGGAVADYATAQTAANAALLASTGTLRYYVANVTDYDGAGAGTDGGSVLFVDRNADGVADQAVFLVGVTPANFTYTDIAG